jgi:hypothetical protein
MRQSFKKTAAAVSLLILSLPMMAQRTIVTGTLRDSLSREAEPFATVRVFRQTDTTKPVAMVVTDADGNIKVDVDGKGDYLMTVASMGKTTVYRRFTLTGQSTLALGDLLTTDDNRALAGVEVVAQKPVVTMTTDKMTYSVQDDADSKTMTLLDMLRKVPMVTVDGQDNVQVKGSSNFKVYVDGKPNQMFQSNFSQIAKSVPASTVERIEVITSPGAKYDAEGTSGVLDIKLVHENGQNGSTNGYNGNVQASLGNKEMNGGAYIGGQQGKLTYSASVNVFYNPINDVKVENTRATASSLGESRQTSTQTFDQHNPFSMGNFSLGYEIDSLRNLDLSVGLYTGHNNREATPFMAYEGGIYGSGFSYEYNQQEKSRWTGVNVSTDYQRWLNAAHTSSLTLSYLFDYNPNRSSTRTLYDDVETTAITLQNLFSDTHTWGTSHTGQADLALDLGSGNTLETGAKFISRRSKSDSRLYNIVDDVDVLNEDASTTYRNLQSIVAGYAQWRIAKEKWNARAGLRYEHTFESVKYAENSDRNFHDNYGNLVPSASLGYNLSQTQNIGLTYTMRISRPGIDQLNPYIDRTDPTALSYGNASLDVMKSHNAAITYNLFTPKVMLNLSLSKDYCGNEIENYSFVDDDDKLNFTYANNGHSSNTSLSAFVRWVASKQTTLMLNGQGGYTDLKAKAIDAHSHGWTGDAYLGIEQQLPWQIKGTGGVMLRSRSYNLMGYQSSLKLFTLSLTRSFLKDRLELSARYINFFGNRLKVTDYTVGTDFSNLTRISVPLQMVSVSVKWNFGNTKKQFAQHESKINNDFNDAHKQSGSVGGVGL